MVAKHVKETSENDFRLANATGMRSDVQQSPE